MKKYYNPLKMAAMLGLFLLGACANHGPADHAEAVISRPEMQRLTDLRLELSRQVAWYKYQNSLPVFDPQREEVLMEKLVAHGEMKGLSAGEVRVFFQKQFAMSRNVQKRLIARWNRGGELPVWPPLSLERDIRPKMMAVSMEMIDALASNQRDIRN